MNFSEIPCMYISKSFHVTILLVFLEHMEDFKSRGCHSSVYQNFH